MSDPNHEIVGRVLQGLRDAALPEGMESRILSKIEHRASTTPAPARSSWGLASLAGGAVLAGMACAFFSTIPRKTPKAAFTRSQEVTLRAVNGPATPSSATTRKPPEAPVPRARVIRVALRKEEEPATLSYPAPAMPLTEQEKLLIRVAHKGDPVELALLDPVQQAKVEANQKARFEARVAQTTTGETDETKPQ